MNRKWKTGIAAVLVVAFICAFFGGMALGNREPPAPLKVTVDMTARDNETAKAITALGDTLVEKFTEAQNSQSIAAPVVPQPSTPQPVTVTVSPVVNVTVTQTMNSNGSEDRSSQTTLSYPSVITFDGLKGSVYNGNFSGREIGILDDGSVLDHDWGSDGPFGLTHFSVKWRGSVVVSESGRYQFSVLADDRVQLYVDGKCRIDKWISGQSITTYTTSVDLTAGHQYTIIVRYFNDIVGDSRIKLSCKRIY